MNFIISKFGDFAKFKYGKMPNKSNIKDSGEYPIYSGYRYVGYSDEYNTDAGQLIIVARGVGGTGDVKLTREKCYLTNLSISTEIDSSVSLPQYLYYYFSMRNLRYLDSGSAQSQLTISDLKKVEIPLPNIESQKKVNRFLNTLDRKISLNESINNNLFEQMQAIYKSWFVDLIPFDGIKPTNWYVTNIYAIASIVYGAPFSSKLFNTDGLGKPIVRIRDLKEQVLTTFTTEKHPKGHLIQPGDIVVGMDGEFRPYLWGNEPAWLNQRVCIFRSNRPLGRAFVLYTLRPLLMKIEQTQVATTVIHIGKKDFDAFELVLPDETTLSNFESITAPMIDNIVNNRLQNKRLAALRDTILPKLMSGELDVSAIDI